MRTLLPALVSVALGACSLVPFDPTPDPAAAPAMVTECRPPFVLHEETTLGALGIGQFEGMGPQLNRMGSVRITEAAVRWEDFAPPDVPAVVPEGQLLCVTWPDGSGLAALLEKPFGEPGIHLGRGGDDGPPITLAGVTFVALVVVGVSWLAFRRDDPAR